MPWKSWDDPTLVFPMLTLLALFVVGGFLFRRGLKAWRRPPYPYRRLAIGLQLGIGGLLLLDALYEGLGTLINVVSTSLGGKPLL